MTGANYTGGKRNVARTRFRDSTRRVQKNHFGRRRLGILSRDLVNGGTHSRTERPTCGISGIQLEHAQKDISRPPHSSPAPETRAAVGVFASDDSLGDGSCESTQPLFHQTVVGRPSEDSSLRAEMDRVLEFSRTVGLYNYATSPTQGAPASSPSRLDSEPGESSSCRQLNETLISPMNKSPGRPRTKAYVDNAAHVPGGLQKSQSRTRSRLHSFRETDSPIVNSKYVEYYAAQSPARSRGTVEPHLGQETDSLGLLEWDPYSSHGLPPSFDALELSTSPLPPSSPLPSSTTYGSLSLYQLPHEVETTVLDSDRISLPAIASSSYGIGPSSRYGDSRHTPNLPSISPSQHISRSNLVHNDAPTLLGSPSKADLMPDLLTCSNPWNVIGDVLGLPPIPSADPTYLSNIQSRDTARVSSGASPSSEQVNIKQPHSSARDGVTRLGTVHSDGDILFRQDPSQLSLSREVSRRASSPLLLRYPHPERILSPEQLLPSNPEACLPNHAEPDLLFPHKSDPTTEVPQSMLVPRIPSGLHRTENGNSGLTSESSSAPVKTQSPCILTPQKSASPSPKNLRLPATSVSHSPGIASTQWDAMVGFDPAAFVSKILTTRATASRGQRPKLECPDLFQDEEDSPTGIF